MVRKSRGICGILGPSWVLTTITYRNSFRLGKSTAAGAPPRDTYHKERWYSEIMNGCTSIFNENVLSVSGQSDTARYLSTSRTTKRIRKTKKTPPPPPRPRQKGHGRNERKKAFSLTHGYLDDGAGSPLGVVLQQRLDVRRPAHVRVGHERLPQRISRNKEGEKNSTIRKKQPTKKQEARIKRQEARGKRREARGNR